MHRAIIQVSEHNLMCDCLLLHKPCDCVNLQVSFPAAPDGDEAAWDVLKDVVRGCLRVSHIAAGRYQAKTVRQKLFNLMVQRGWNNDVSAL
jgi:hypothetical protein